MADLFFSTDDHMFGRRSPSRKTRILKVLPSPDPFLCEAWHGAGRSNNIGPNQLPVLWANHDNPGVFICQHHGAGMGGGVCIFRILEDLGIGQVYDPKMAGGGASVPKKVEKSRGMIWLVIYLHI